MVTRYDGTAKELVKLYKFGRARSAAPIIAQALDDSLPFFGPDTLVTYVPTATSRLRQRGYDQAELIATEFARIRGLRCERTVTRVTQLRQVGSTKRQRTEQLKHAFIAHRRRDAMRETILLVDDVVTTGSTLEAVATVLRDAGAKHVDAVVFAQKV